MTKISIPDSLSLWVEVEFLVGSYNCLPNWLLLGPDQTHHAPDSIACVGHSKLLGRDEEVDRFQNVSGLLGREELADRWDTGLDHASKLDAVLTKPRKKKKKKDVHLTCVLSKIAT